MARRALLVGIDAYDHLPDLSGCVEDTLALEALLANHANNAPNYACKRLTSDATTISRRILLDALRELCAFEDEVLFAFSGHGVQMPGGVYLATQNGVETLPGIGLHELLQIANESPAREILLILDCCHSGALGEPALLGNDSAYLRPGVTLLAASRPEQPALGDQSGGVFTGLIRGALSGAGADLRGRVTAASIYAYVEQALGPWDQRPIYKSNASRLTPVRYCYPEIWAQELRRLPEFFTQPDALFRMDPSYEYSFPEAVSEHVAIFQLFKKYRDARLLKPTLHRDLYFAAKYRTDVALTPLGQFYWQLARDQHIDADPAFLTERNLTMPDAEAVARLFHETYERLAPKFGYATREATAVPWSDVPEQNKQLMVAVSAEILATLFPPEASVPPREDPVR